MTSRELYSLRAKRGFAKQKAELLKEYEMLEALGWHFAILCVNNELSTYNGMYPEGVGVARDKNRNAMKALQEKISEICLKK